MSRHGAGGCGRQGMSGERGSSAVEAAIVTPVVMALLFGIIELGFLFKDYLAAAGAVRAGVRIASAIPRNAIFARAAADSVARTGGAMNMNDVQELWIYKVNLKTAPAASQDKPIGRTDFNDCDVCVQFRWDAPTQTFVTTSNAAHPGLKDNWPYSTQNACSSSSLTDPPDRIGVYLKLKHDPFTGLVFNTVYISEASIMTLEPISSLTGCR